MARLPLPIGFQDFRKIREKRYHQAFWNLGKTVVGIGVNFSSTTKNIDSWETAELA